MKAQTINSLPVPSPWLAARIAVVAPDHLGAAEIIAMATDNPGYYAYLYNEYRQLTSKPYLIADRPNEQSAAHGRPSEHESSCEADRLRLIAGIGNALKWTGIAILGGTILIHMFIPLMLLVIHGGTR